MAEHVQESGPAAVDAVEPAHVAAEPASTIGDASQHVAVAPAMMSAGAILALQRSAGNQAVGRMISASAPLGVYRGVLGGITDAIGDALDVRTDEERLDAEEELEKFRDKTFPPLKNHHPSSGLGQFDGSGDMRAGTMTITLKVAYKFIDGDATKVAAGFRPEEFKWQPGEAAKWKTRYQSDVSGMWSTKFQAKSTKKHWTKMLVDTTVQVVEDASSPHFTLSVEKMPPDAGMVQSSICPPGFHHNAATGNCLANAAGDGTGTAALDSNDMRPEQKLDWGNASAAIPFEEGSSALTAGGTAALAPIITAVAGVAGAHVEITGHASSKHKAGVTPADGAIANMDLARARSGAVQAAIIAGGATADQILMRNAGEDGATAGKEWCRADAQVGTHQTQNPALHETGHMLGNDDEYPTSSTPAGSPMEAKYDAMIKSQTGDVVTAGRNESAMSVGSTVQRWNYAAFLEALKALTSESDWSL